jgi:hypothetical protein
MAEIPPSFFCPITHDMFKDPVTLGTTGHTFERSAISDWLQRNTTDPLSNAHLTDSTLAPNFALRDAISDYLRRVSGNIIGPADLVLGELIGSGSSKDVYRGQMSGNASVVVLDFIACLFYICIRWKSCGSVAFEAGPSY